MSEISDPGSEPLTPDLDRICDRFEAAWQAAAAPDQRPRIEDYLKDAREPVHQVLIQELIALDVAYRRRHGEAPTAEKYRLRFPGLESAFLKDTLDALPPGGRATTSRPPEQVPPRSRLDS